MTFDIELSVKGRATVCVVADTQAEAERMVTRRAGQHGWLVFRDGDLEEWKITSVELIEEDEEEPKTMLDLKAERDLRNETHHPPLPT